MQHLAAFADDNFVQKHGFQARLAIVRRVVVGLRRCRRCINSPSKPSPSSLLAKQSQFIRGPDDAAQRTGSRRAKSSLSRVAQVALSTRPVPAAVLVSSGSSRGHELSTSLHTCAISVVVRKGCGGRHDLIHMFDRWAGSASMSPRCLELLSDALEGNVSLRYLEDDRTLRLSIVTTGLAAEVRPGLLRSLEAKDAYRLHQRLMC